jgi:hypothetical protein
MQPNIRILSEAETVVRCLTHSIARFGDGELRLALGGSAVSQRADKGLAVELRTILRDAVPGLLVGLPNFAQTPRQDVWSKYADGKFASLYVSGREYASSFITRPDSAPWIDTPEYWRAVSALWEGQDVVLVAGDQKSLTPEMLTMTAAASVRSITAPPRDAYSDINRIEHEVGQHAGLVILCLGATATVLAARLHRRGIHALDLGHLGMFMRHAGAFSFKSEHLASDEYRRQLQEKHATSVWGKHGHSHAPEILQFLEQIGGRTVLDYGCGRATLAKALPNIKTFEYDPGVPGKHHLPKLADLVVATDVLEHVEPQLLDGVLRHIYLLARRGAYLVIATRPARELLPDGRNAHLIIESSEWWVDQLKKYGWNIVRTEQRKGFCVWLQKQTS